jgi:hypothetical protein
MGPGFNSGRGGGKHELDMMLRIHNGDDDPSGYTLLRHVTFRHRLVI